MLRWITQRRTAPELGHPSTGNNCETSGNQKHINLFEISWLSKWDHLLIFWCRWRWFGGVLSRTRTTSFTVDLSMGSEELGFPHWAQSCLKSCQKDVKDLIVTVWAEWLGLIAFYHFQLFCRATNNHSYNSHCSAYRIQLITRTIQVCEATTITAALTLTTKTMT